MPALTRRRDSDRPDRWDIYFGDISVGSIGKCAGVPLHVDQWEWGCGLATASDRLSANGTAASFDDARNAFGAAWAKLEPLIRQRTMTHTGASAPGRRGSMPCTTPVYPCPRS
jgi:hypothetical protein